jgi:CheY-like chemotaxis protein
MDMLMPEMDGLEAARRIRAVERALGRPRIPIVALTANATEADRSACERATVRGGDAYPRGALPGPPKGPGSVGGGVMR